MSLIDRFLMSVAPAAAARRERDRLVAMHYRASRLGQRSDSLRPTKADANVAGQSRARVAQYMRDLVRNAPFAARGQAVISNNVVGDGIIPKITITEKLRDRELAQRLKDRGMAHITASLDTVHIDKKGLQNLYGLQRQVMNTVVESGEALVRRHVLPVGACEGLPLQIEVLEPEYLDTGRQWAGQGSNIVRDGIEYDEVGQRVAYWLFEQHPGGEFIPSRSQIQSVRVPVDEVIHVFRPDRPGQDRGISWLAPVAEKMLMLDDYEDAQLMRQRIAACFAAFRRLSADGDASPEIGKTLMPGTIVDIGQDEDVVFAAPPVASGDDQFKGTILRSIAMGLGISYEALTGDLSGVNFSSARIGRLEMDRNVSSWQWLMMVPQMMQPLGGWILDAWAELEASTGEAAHLPISDFIGGGGITLDWVPPVRLMIDPSGEFAAYTTAVRSGFMSRQGVVRTTGIDPERLMQEQHQDMREADQLGLIFDSDPRRDISRQILKQQQEGARDA